MDNGQEFLQKWGIGGQGKKSPAKNEGGSSPFGAQSFLQKYGIAPQQKDGRPKGTRTAYLPKSLGGGAYNEGAPGELIDTGHTSYGGLKKKKGQERDDIVPVALGGANQDPKNLQYQSFKEGPFGLLQGPATYKDNVEKYFISQYKKGKISLNAARVAALNWQGTDIPGQDAYDKRLGGPQNTFTNFITSLVPSAEKIGGYIYDIAGSFVGATHDELRSKQFLEDTAAAIPKSAYNLGKSIATQPIKTAQSLVGGVAKGAAKSVSDAIINNFVDPTQREGKRQAVEDTINKFLGSTPETPISSGAEAAGQALPYIAASEVGGAAAGLGARAAGLSGTPAAAAGYAGSKAGFLGLGQASLPREASAKERLDNALQNLVQQGIFEAGSAGFGAAKSALGHAADHINTTAISAALDSFPSLPSGLGGYVKNPFYKGEGGGVDPNSAPKETMPVADQISQLKEQISVLKDTMDPWGVSKLMKYFAGKSPGDFSLAELQARGEKAGLKGSRLDDIIQNELGLPSMEAADQALRHYLSSKKLIGEMTAKMRDLQDKQNIKESSDQQKDTPVSGLRPIKQYAFEPQFGRPAPVEIPITDVSEGAQFHGLYQVEQGEIKNGPFKGWAEHVSDLFQYGFADKRKPDTLEIAGARARQQFEPLREQGINSILRFEGYERAPDGMIVKRKEGPDRSGLLGNVQEAEDLRFKQVRNAGVQQKGKPIPYRQNHIRIYIKTPEGDIVSGETGELVAVSGRKVARTPGFALPRTFNTNAEVLQAGYQLAFDNMPDNQAASAMEVQKAIADATIFNEGALNGLVFPSPALSRHPKISGGYKMYDPQRFPKHTMRYRDNKTGEIKEYVGPYWGPADFVDRVNQYLYDPSSGTPFERKVAKLASWIGATKQTALSIGIPNVSKVLEPVLGKQTEAVLGKRAADALRRGGQLGSGFSVHFWNLFLKRTPFSQAPRMFYYGLDPESAANWMKAHLDDAARATESGLMISAEDQQQSFVDLKDLTSIAGAGRQYKQASKWLHDVFGGALFGKVMPAISLRLWMKARDKLIKKGYSQTEAERLAADSTNTTMGSINKAVAGKLLGDKNFQNWLRMFALAPDWATSNIQLGTRGIRGLRNWNDPRLIPYRNFVMRVVIMYTIQNIIQKMLVGSFSVQNDPTHLMSLKVGRDEKGRNAYWNVMGTGAEFIRIPAMVADASVRGDLKDMFAIIGNRLSIPVRSAEELLSNTDWSGRAIYGTDNFGNPIPPGQQAANMFNATIGAVAPSWSTAALSIMSGRATLQQSILQGLALPVGYKSETPTVAQINQLKKEAAQGIKNGDYKLYNELVQTGAIPLKSRNAFIRKAIRGQTAKQAASAAKRKAQLQQTKLNLEQMGITSSGTP